VASGKKEKNFHATPLPSYTHVKVHCTVCAMQSGTNLR